MSMSFPVAGRLALIAIFESSFESHCSPQESRLKLEDLNLDVPTAALLLTFQVCPRTLTRAAWRSIGLGLRGESDSPNWNAPWRRCLLASRAARTRVPLTDYR